MTIWSPFAGSQLLARVSALGRRQPISETITKLALGDLELDLLTRPLSATVGNFLDKPVVKGKLEFTRPLAPAALAVVIVLLIVILPQRAGHHPGTERG